MTLERFRPPTISAEAVDGWAEETHEYVARIRRKPKFKSILDGARLFARGPNTKTHVTTRMKTEPVDGEASFELFVRHQLASMSIEERFECSMEDGLFARRLERTLLDLDGEIRRKEEIDFRFEGLGLPVATYPEVLLPFLMRGQPRDDETRAAYAWSVDRFIARVYYERRSTETLVVEAGRFEADQVWMYPDLNDWISMGNVLTRLAKPLLPRYEIWFEHAAPHRMLKFEGAYGPPGAPEIVLELARA